MSLSKPKNVDKMKSKVFCIRDALRNSEESIPVGVILSRTSGTTASENAYFYLHQTMFLKVSLLPKKILCYKNSLIKNIGLISKLMTSQTIVIHILPNISRSKDNQTIKFGQLIEYNTVNIFFSKNMQKMRQVN